MRFTSGFVRSFADFSPRGADFQTDCVVEDRNIQHPTSNIQHPTSSDFPLGHSLDVGRSMLGVGCSFALSWRPRHRSSAQNMAVQVRHRFPAVRAVVDDQPVAARFQSQPVRDFSGFQQQVAQQFVVRRRCLGDAGQGLLGENQDTICAGISRATILSNKVLLMTEKIIREGREFSRIIFSGFHSRPFAQFAEEGFIPPSASTRWARFRCGRFRRSGSRAGNSRFGPATVRSAGTSGARRQAA